MKQIELSVEGMDCANCALGIERHLSKLGATDVQVSFATASARLTVADENRLRSVISELKRLGYPSRIKSASVNDAGQSTNARGLSLETKFFASLIFTVPLLLAMLIPGGLLMRPYMQLSLTLPVFGIGTLHFGRSALRSLRTGVPNMDVLIFIGITSAFFYSFLGELLGLGHDYLFYETSATISTIVLFGNLLEKRAVRKTTTAIEELGRIQPSRAKRIIPDGKAGEIEEIDTALIAPGDVLLVNSGDQVPTDGEIIWGEGLLDESMISGESAPLVREVRDRVIGGSIVSGGAIRVRAMAVGEDTVLSHIIRLVKSAQNSKPQIQRIGDRVSAVFVPAVLVVALATFVGWSLFAGASFQTALMNAIAVLVISCPCAMGLATPTAIMVGIGRAAKSGILIKGGDTLEKFAVIRKIVFDKTGTITTGNFVVRDFQVKERDPAFVKSAVHGLEQHSSHPIARSLVRIFAEELPMPFLKVEERKGLGMRGDDGSGRVFEIGSQELVAEMDLREEHDLWILENGKVIGFLDIMDEAKPDTAKTISQLRALQITPVLLSGDTQRKCEAISGAVGIPEIYAEQTPVQKLEVISRLEEKAPTGFVGDGINDAPALARASVGISLSDATGAAIESAQIVLFKGDLQRLVQAFVIARRTLRVIKQNLFWALIYNILAIPLASLGFLHPLVASLAMAMSDVIVVINSLRLKQAHLYSDADLRRFL